LRSKSGVIYDEKSNESIGVWNEKEEKIEFDAVESETELCATEIMSESEDCE
jgi:hypothetical protein